MSFPEQTPASVPSSALASPSDIELGTTFEPDPSAPTNVDAVVVSLPPDDAVFGWDYPWLRDQLRARHIPHLRVFSDPCQPIPPADDERLLVRQRDHFPGFERRPSAIQPGRADHGGEHDIDIAGRDQLRNGIRPKKQFGFTRELLPVGTLK